MSTKKTSLRAAREQIDRIIWRIEAWQARCSDRFDSRGYAGAAKSKLIDLVRELESKESETTKSAKR